MQKVKYFPFEWTTLSSIFLVWLPHHASFDCFGTMENMQRMRWLEHRCSCGKMNGRPFNTYFDEAGKVITDWNVWMVQIPHKLNSQCENSLPLLFLHLRWFKTNKNRRKKEGKKFTHENKNNNFKWVSFTKHRETERDA